MIFFFTLIMFFFGCIHGDGESSPSGEFTLRAEVVEALEDGPLVVKATLCYHGNQPAEVYWKYWNANANIEIPQNWKARSIVRLLIGASEGRRRLAPGAEITESLRIHNEYSGIVSGKAILTVRWNVYAAGKGAEPGNLIAELSVPLEIDIPPATPERLAALRERMEEQLRRRDLSERDRRTVANDILDTQHHALAPVAWEMIGTPGRIDPTDGLIRFVAECSEDLPDLDVRLAKLAADPKWPATRDGLNYLQNRKTDLSPTAWKTLTEADSVWTRALVYRFFPERCDKDWKAALLQELRTQTQPPPASQFNRLLADLDDDDFNVREQASAQLTRLGERVETPLRHAQDGTLSPEARRRVDEILRKLRDEKEPPECIRTLRWMESSTMPETGEILEALAQGSPDDWLTRQAKKQLEQWHKAQQPPPGK